MSRPLVETQPYWQVDNIVNAICWIFILWAVVGGVWRWWNDHGKWW